MTCIWNNFFSVNTTLLKTRFPDLYKILESEINKIFSLFQSAENQILLPNSLEILNTVFPFWNFFLAKDGSLCAKEDGIFLHSSYSPKKEVQKLFTSDEISNSRLTWIFAGIGLGFAPIEFAKLNKNKNLIVIIEPEPSFLFAAMSCLDWTPFFNQSECIIITQTSPEQACTLLDSLKVLNNAKIVTQNSQTKHQQLWFKNFFTLFDRNKQKQNINNSTLKKFSTLWLKNSTKNLKYFSCSDGINIYKNMIDEKIPAIVCAAGPTLQEVLPELATLKDKSVIICVDTALRPLLKHNIVPDFVILIDPQYYAANHIQGLSALESVLVTESSVYPSVMRFNCRKKVFCESLFPLGRYFENLLLPEKSFGKIIAGGSVSTSAWDFAKFIGAKKIYMAGLDLGYPNKQTHIKGSTFEEKSHTTSTKLNPAENSLCEILFNATIEKSIDYSNNQIITDTKMKLFAWWFESQFSKYPEISTFTLSPKSQKIPGMKIADLNTLKKFDNIQSQKKQAFENAEAKNCRFSKGEFELEFSRLKTLLEELYSIAKSGFSYCQEILEQPPLVAEKLAQQKFDEFQKIDNQILNSKVKDVASLVFPVQEQLDELYKNLSDFQEPTLKLIAQSRIIYQQIMKAILQFQKYL